VQDLALGLVEPHEVHTAPLLEPVQVPLDGIPSFWCVWLSVQERSLSSEMLPWCVNLFVRWDVGRWFVSQRGTWCGCPVDHQN